MSIGNKKKAIGITAACLAIATAGFLIFNPFNLTKSNDEPSSGPSADDGNPTLIRRASSMTPSYNLEEIAERAELIVTGKVGSGETPILVQPVLDDAEPRFFTDRSIKVDKVLKGTPQYSSDNTITLRTEGGAGEIIEMVDDAVPSLEKGDSYLFFLYTIPDGSSYNTEGNHYYIIGISSGAWKQTQEGTYENPSALEEVREASVNEVEQAVAMLSANDESANQLANGAQATIDKIEQDYREGELTEEAYHDAIAIAKEEAGSYATILTGDAARQAEEKLMEAHGGETTSSPIS